MQSVQDQEKILKEYQKQGEEITRQMLNILMRAQKKIDNPAYRKVLEDLQKESN